MLGMQYFQQNFWGDFLLLSLKLEGKFYPIYGTGSIFLTTIQVWMLQRILSGTGYAFLNSVCHYLLVSSTGNIEFYLLYASNVTLSICLIFCSEPVSQLFFLPSIKARKKTTFLTVFLELAIQVQITGQFVNCGAKFTTTHKWRLKEKIFKTCDVDRKSTDLTVFF